LQELIFWELKKYYLCSDKKNMEFKDISKWFWDIAKYVISAIIISSFLGGYSDDTTMLYVMSGLISLTSIIAGTIFYLLSKKK